MSLSLQEQLLKAKLVSEKQVKETQKQQRKKKKQAKGQKEVDELKLSAQQALLEKAEKAKLLNQQKNAAAEKKALQAQIKQLIELNKINCHDGELAYQFVDDKNIKKILVNEPLQTQLTKGIIAIAKNGNTYAMVPKVIAEKISQRDSSVVIVQNTSDQHEDDDDPYADYKIPDDLTW